MEPEEVFRRHVPLIPEISTEMVRCVHYDDVFACFWFVVPRKWDLTFRGDERLPVLPDAVNLLLPDRCLSDPETRNKVSVVCRLSAILVGPASTGLQCGLHTARVRCRHQISRPVLLHVDLSRVDC